MFSGIPFDVIPFRTQIAELSQSILGDALIGLQGGNEPDLYAPYVEFAALRCLKVNFD